MDTSQFVSQPSCDLDVYLPSQINDEDSLLYKSPEGLLRSVNIDTQSSAHRNESEIFDPINDDMEASIALTNDELLLILNNNLELCPNIDDIYNFHNSTVVPHTFNLPTESRVNHSLPSSQDIHINQQKTVSTPTSPINCNCINMKKWIVFDQTTGRERRPLLHEFIRLLLENDEYSDVAEYLDRKQGIFKLYRPKDVAELWKHVKGRNSDTKMTYDKLARAIRYYYSSGIMHSTPGRFTFRFGVKSGFGETWSPVYS